MMNIVTVAEEMEGHLLPNNFQKLNPFFNLKIDNFVQLIHKKNKKYIKKPKINYFI